MKITPLMAATIISVAALPAFAQQQLVVVQDKGGVSAQPYYEGLGLIAEPQPPLAAASPLNLSVTDSEMLPVRSTRLSPGIMSRQTIQAPNLATPIFLVGDDELSKKWLRHRAAVLEQRHAVGLVVNVATAQALNQLRALVPNVKLSPIAGDDIAQRLGLAHYPVLITADAIEQ